MKGVNHRAIRSFEQDGVVDKESCPEGDVHQREEVGLG